MLFWTPVLVLVAWIHGNPLSLLFDTFEVVLVIVAGFLLNRVTSNSETNWAEGVLLVVFYSMVVRTLSSHFYPLTIVKSGRYIMVLSRQAGLPRVIVLQCTTREQYKCHALTGTLCDEVVMSINLRYLIIQ